MNKIVSKEYFSPHVVKLEVEVFIIAENKINDERENKRDGRQDAKHNL